MRKTTLTHVVHGAPDRVALAEPHRERLLLAANVELHLEVEALLLQDVLVALRKVKEAKRHCVVH